MKFKGEKLSPPKPEIVAFCHDGTDIVFTVQMVTDYSEFDKLCQPPKPRKRTLKGGKVEYVTDTPEYRKEEEKIQLNRFNWMILKSLEATEDLEWETVDPTDPETWANYRKELYESGFTNAEIGKLQETIIRVNTFDAGKMEEARQRFLASREEQAKLSSQADEASSTQSGESVNDS